nr:MAG TPA: terminase large subunit [Caudoviricetes sp.]
MKKAIKGRPLSKCIGKAFYSVHKDIQAGKHTYYDLTGGRGSLKSSCVSVEIIYNMMKKENKNKHAVIYRKVGDTLETSVFAQIEWAIDILGVSRLWKLTKSPMRAEYLPTGQKIIFKGLDKAAKSKSIKVPFGYIGYLWFEEFDEFSGEEEIRKVQQSVIRGGNDFVVFKSMNPPKSRQNWANYYIDKEKLRKDTLVSQTTYLTSPKEWLGQQFIDDAEWLKMVNPKAYKHEYLGIPIGNGTEVFDNLEIRQITDEEIARFDRLYRGVDWGWFPDPFHYGCMHYDSARMILYIFEEFRTNKMRNSETGKILKDKFNLGRYDVVICDSAENKSIADYRSYGINARGAEKGPDSVRYGMKWLQSLIKIVIDPVRCPNTAEEFKKYEYELDKDGNPTSVYPDANNHSIDMTRYAMERVWKRKGK